MVVFLRVPIARKICNIKHKIISVEAMKASGQVKLQLHPFLFQALAAIFPGYPPSPPR
jgi:hypothetical protein